MVDNKYDWKKIKDWKYPYKGNTLSDPKYIKDREKLFKDYNGWWVNDGKGWAMDWESPMVYHRRKRKERGLK